MDYNFKRIADVEEMESVSEDTMLLVNDNGVIKQAHAQMQGGGWPSDLPKPSVGGYGYTESGNQTVIDWDGDTEGREKIDLEEMTLYKISHVTPASSEFIGNKFYYYSTDDGLRPITIDADFIMTSDSSDGTFIIGEADILVADSAGSVSFLGGEVEFSIPTAGIYFAESYYGHTSYVMYGSRDTQHKIDDRYLYDEEIDLTNGVTFSIVDDSVSHTFGVSNSMVTPIAGCKFIPKLKAGETYVISIGSSGSQTVGGFTYKALNDTTNIEFTIDDSMISHTRDGSAFYDIVFENEVVVYTKNDGSMDSNSLGLQGIRLYLDGSIDLVKSYQHTGGNVSISLSEIMFTVNLIALAGSFSETEYANRYILLAGAGTNSAYILSVSGDQIVTTLMTLH